MRRPKLILITPVWAQQIEVEKRGNKLHVTGWGRLVDPFDAKQIAPDQVSSIDIFHRFRRYALRHLNGRRTGEDAGIYQFADATTDAKLIAFVQEFGPVMGKVLSTTIEDNGTMTITVEQSMERLRQEQREFAGAVTLLQEVNKKRNTHTVEDCATLSVAMLDVRLPGTWMTMTNNFLSTQGSIRQKAASILPLAHQALCMLLNECPPKLVPFDDKAMEVGVVQDEGIRNAIYWQLRRDYLAQREIGVCLHCDNHFPIYRRGTEGCGQSCRRALSNRKYWSANKKGIGRRRKMTVTGRK